MRSLCLAIAILIPLLIPRASCGCSCAEQGPAVAFNAAKAVFIGRMLGGTESLSVQVEKGESRSIEAGEVRFTVEEVFKGGLGTEATIRIASNKGTSCGPYGLERDERYIVYAYSGRDDADALYSGVCTRTVLVDSSSAKEDLDFLRNLPPAGTGGKINGRVWADLREGRPMPLANIQVKIVGGGQVVKAKTDQEGRFEVKDLKPGKYRVEPEFPENYVGSSQFEEVIVDDLGTASVRFDAYINGLVQGRMIDRTGRPFNSVFLTLAGNGRSILCHFRTGDGVFQAEGVPPGEYLMLVELQGADRKSSKKYYYPGTFERDEATVIKVGLGEQVKGLEFPLPEGSNVRTIRGQVTWEDGALAADVEVFLECPQSAKPGGFVVQSGPTKTVTNQFGQFQFEGISGEVYWIESRGRNNKKKDEVFVYSRPRKLVLNENLEGLTVVLSERGGGGGCVK